MCMLCVEENIANLPIRKIQENARELVTSASDDRAREHILETLRRIYNERNSEMEENDGK